MDHNDRERAFEQALARHLRAQDSSNRPAETSPATDDDSALCPDSEALAAFHEGTLPAAEMAAVQEHVAGCPRCRETVELLRATDETAVRDEPAGAPAAVTAISQARRPAKVFRWIAPAGAIAALLLIWVTARQRPPHMESARSVEIAQEQRLDDRQDAASREPERDSSTYPTPAPSSQSNQNKAKRPSEPGPSDSKPQHSTPLDADSISGTLSAQNRRTNLDKFDDQPRRQESKKSAPSPAESGGAAVNPEEKESRDARAANLQAEVRNETTSMPKTAQPLTPAPASPPARETLAKNKGERLKEPSGSASTGATPVPAPPLPSNGAAKDASQPRFDESRNAPASAPSAVAAEQAEVTGNAPSAPVAQAEQGQMSALKTAPIVVIARDGTARWRLAGGGLIERSYDRGESWSRQPSGVTADLLAGSAPSASVCWLVGRAGTILRTTDGGAHWSKVVAPFPGDIRGIEAADALHATILAGDPPARFVTSDGGIGWAPVKETR